MRIDISSEVLVSELGHHSSTWSALYETFHNEVWLVYLFHCTCILANGSGDGGDTHRSTLELVDNGKEYLVVGLVKSIAVDIECREREL